MKPPNITIIFILGLVSFSACTKSLVIENVNYAQYVESVLIPDETGFIEDYRNNIRFSIEPIVEEEFGENSEEYIQEVRLIRNRDGFYFITADGFKNVYVFEPKKGVLKLKETIKIDEGGLVSPIFNWRAPYVELLTVNKEIHVYLSEKGEIEPINEEGK